MDAGVYLVSGLSQKQIHDFYPTHSVSTGPLENTQLYSLPEKNYTGLVISQSKTNSFSFKPSYCAATVY